MVLFKLIWTYSIPTVFCHTVRYRVASWLYATPCTHLKPGLLYMGILAHGYFHLSSFTYFTNRIAPNFIFQPSSWGCKVENLTGGGRIRSRHPHVQTPNSFDQCRSFLGLTHIRGSVFQRDKSTSVKHLFHHKKKIFLWSVCSLTSNKTGSDFILWNCLRKWIISKCR